MQATLICGIVKVKRIGQKRCGKRGGHGTRSQETEQEENMVEAFSLVLVVCPSYLRAS